MKRLVLAALAIGAMAACTKSNVQLEQSGEISLHPVAQKATKAAIDGTAYPTSESFNVWSWWGNYDAGTTLDEFKTDVTPYISEGTFVNRNGNSWGGQTPYYWPTKGSLVFAGYSPATSKNMGKFEYLLAEKQFKVTDFVQPNTIDSAVDLMWFDVTDKFYDQNGTNGGVPVVFKHALSWLTFKFNLASATTDELWTITKVELNGIEDKGNFTAKGGTSTWNGWLKSDNGKDVISLYNGSYLIKYNESASVLPGTDIVTEGSNVRTNAALVIPQSCAKDAAELVITYNLQTSIENSVLTGQTVSLPLTGTQITNNMWEPGKHYIYTITFGGNEILISPTVTDWTDVDVDNIPVQ